HRRDEARDRRSFETRVVVERRRAHREIVDRRAAAHAARRRGERTAPRTRDPLGRERHARSRKDFDDVAEALFPRTPAMRDRTYVLDRLDHAFGEEEAERELAVVAGG